MDVINGKRLLLLKKKKYVKNVVEKFHKDKDE